jgi:hypothetical protein
MVRLKYMTSPLLSPRYPLMFSSMHDMYDTSCTTYLLVSNTKAHSRVALMSQLYVAKTADNCSRMVASHGEPCTSTALLGYFFDPTKLYSSTAFLSFQDHCEETTKYLIL